MRRLLLLVLLAPALATAQTPGTCALGTAQTDLTTPDLSARLFNTGSLFYASGSTAADYTVPRASGGSPVYAAGLWVGGRVDGDVRTAGGTYGSPSGQFTFWPGPLDAGAALPNPADCSAYDRIWRVSPADVAAYEAGGTPAVDLREWPVGLGAPAVDAQGQPVPVGSRDQRIDLPGGERPVLGGGPTAFWVMNDVGNARGEAGALPLGIEVQVTAFAPTVGSLAFRQATVYRYRIVNRSSATITGLHAGFFADPDLGDSSDDYFGADTTRGMAYVYNADNTDGTGAGTTYGTPPPAFGFDLLAGLWGSSRFYSSTGPEGDPRTTAEVYNRLRGLWNDATPIRAFGNGYAQTQGQIVRSMFPGDPVSGLPWSEVNPGPGYPANAGGDGRIMLSAPPVTLAPGASTTFDMAMVFAQGADYLDSVTALRAASDRVQAAYNAGLLFSGTLASGTAAAPALVAPEAGALFYETPATFSWQPVAGAESYVFETSPTPTFAEVDVLVVSGTSVTLPVDRFPANRPEAIYWRVRTTLGGLDGPPGEARAVRLYHYVPGALTLASGAVAIVETTAPGGGPACMGPDDPDQGCAEVGGDLVLGSLNSTGDYAAYSSAPTASANRAPRDFEIRFTAQGSVAAAGSGSTGRLFRVPFELWDIGIVAPGAVNDPSDDRQLVAFVTGATACRWGYDLPTRQGTGPATPSMRAYLPTGDDYAAYAALAEAAVAADPAGCPTGTATSAAHARVNRVTDPPISSFWMEQAGARQVADLAGATIRFYTADRFVGAEAGAPDVQAVRLGAPYPNPSRGVLTADVSVPVAGRLRVVDVLGRTVWEQPVEAGARAVSLDGRRLAAGVYALVLEAGTARATRAVTVVR